ncbi:MAG: hypothetical protein WCX74_01950 [Candidatus Paceibacterota bacterium]
MFMDDEIDLGVRVFNFLFLVSLLCALLVFVGTISYSIMKWSSAYILQGGVATIVLVAIGVMFGILGSRTFPNI